MTTSKLILHSEFVLRTEEETAALAKKIADAIAESARLHGLLVGLDGELGSGKTTFTRYLAAAFGARVSASSPTFVLAHEYPCKDGLVIEHWDLYRVRGSAPEELKEGRRPKILQIVEWISNDADLLAEADCVITFKITTGSERKAAVKMRPDSPLDKLLRV